MQPLKTVLVFLASVGALALAWASPSAAVELPDMHVLSGETYPATAKGTIENEGGVVAEFETELGEKLTATFLFISAELKELSALGPISLAFHGTLEPKSKTFCNTISQPSGTAVVSGEYHIVVTKTEPLTAAVLILFNEATFECNSGKLKPKLRSPALIKLEKVTSGTDVTEYGLVANCVPKGKQELKEYFNEESKLAKGVLSANFGLGFETACLRTSKELVLKSTKMDDFLF
jgi:hypothetical protein